MIVHYDSLSEFAAAARPHVHNVRTDSWSGDETPEQALKMLETGNEKLVSEAQAMVDKIEATIELPTREWANSPFGAVHCIPEVLSGYPMPSRRMVLSASEGAPLRIFVSTTSSGGIDAKDLAKRGTAILALCMVMQLIRPVEVYTFTEMNGRDKDKATILITRIGSAPVSLAHACHALTSVRLARSFTYEMGRRLNGFTGSWAPGHGHFSGQAAEQMREKNHPYLNKLRGWLGATEQDLILPGPYVRDPLIQDPVAWVNETVKALMGTDD